MSKTNFAGKLENCLWCKKGFNLEKYIRFCHEAFYSVPKPT